MCVWISRLVMNKLAFYCLDRLWRRGARGLFLDKYNIGCFFFGSEREVHRWNTEGCFWICMWIRCSLIIRDEDAKYNWFLLILPHGHILLGQTSTARSSESAPHSEMILFFLFDTNVRGSGGISEIRCKYTYWLLDFRKVEKTKVTGKRRLYMRVGLCGFWM